MPSWEGAPFESQHRLVRCPRQWLQCGLFFGERLVDDPMRCGVHPRIGDCIEPMPKLAIEIVEIPERAAEEEVLADVSERPLDLALRLRPTWAACARLKAIMPSKIEKRGIINHETVRILAEDRGFHAIVQNLAWTAADRFESGDVTAQNTLQILMYDEAGPDQPGLGEDHGEEPDDTPDSRLVGELHVELRKTDLRLFAGRRPETHFEAICARRPQFA
jgi:hypothetical protein